MSTEISRYQAVYLHIFFVYFSITIVSSFEIYLLRPGANDIHVSTWKCSFWSSICSINIGSGRRIGVVSQPIIQYVDVSIWSNLDVGLTFDSKDHSEKIFIKAICTRRAEDQCEHRNSNSQISADLWFWHGCFRLSVEELDVRIFQIAQSPDSMIEHEELCRISSPARPMLLPVEAAVGARFASPQSLPQSTTMPRPTPRACRNKPQSVNRSRYLACKTDAARKSNVVALQSNVIQRYEP